jgi:tRNA A37 threonylcarbamoyladenosine dehydratase
VFSREAVKQANTNGDATDDVQGDGSLNCRGYGSMVTVTATFGMVAAGLIIEKLAKGS